MGRSCWGKLLWRSCQREAVREELLGRCCWQEEPADETEFQVIVLGWRGSGRREEKQKEGCGRRERRGGGGRGRRRQEEGGMGHCGGAVGRRCQQTKKNSN